MARKIGGLAALTVAAIALLTTTAFAQSPALVPRDSRPFTPPDTQAPPPHANAPAQPQPPAQALPAQAQPPVGQPPSPVSQGMATIAPAPLLQKPAVPPVVSMQSGLLSIDATNSNLSDVLAAVKRATGAVIEGGNNATDRVVVHLGPGRPNDVISALLTGSRYDYVLLGSSRQPGAVTRIMLTVRQGGDQVPASQAAASNAPRNVPPPANNGGDEEGAQEDTPEQREQDVRQAEPPPAAPEGAQPGQPQNPQNPQQPGAQNNDQPKTPQQLFEEIQRMQQQRQQDQQNQQNQQNQQQAPPPPDNEQ